MNHPKISIILPVYNAAPYVGEAIESLLHQTFTDFELIIIDDGSRDESVSRITAFKDQRIRLYKNESNLGLIKTLNKGLELARGEYIARMDADDISLPRRLEIQYNFLEKNKNIMGCGTYMKTFGAGHELWGGPYKAEEVRAALLFFNVLNHPSMMLRREIFAGGNYFYSESYPHAEDYELWVRITKKYPLANIPKVLVRYRLHEKSVSSFHQAEQKSSFYKALFDLLFELGLRPDSEEKRLHAMINFDDKKISRAEAKTMLAWFKKIEEQNKVRGIYQPEALKKVISYIIYSIFSIPGNKEARQELRRNSYWRYLNFEQKLKMFIKSIIL